MENKKQTAVEWLEQEFIALQNYGVNELGLFEKAKAMEKEQIIHAYDEGDIQLVNAQQYYNKTYGAQDNGKPEQLP
jgi:hypothetical protein